MAYFNTHQGRLFYDFSLDDDERGKIDGLLRLFEDSTVAELIKDERDPSSSGPDGFNRYDLFAAVIYGFAIGKSTLRELEDACRFDTRFMYIMDFRKPTYVTFANFINGVILPKSEEIFSCIAEAIFRDCGINMDSVFVDGTKIEADANKYKFVWKPTAFHEKLDGKIRNLLSVMGISREVPGKGFISSKELSGIITRLSAKTGADDEPTQGRIASLIGYLTKVTEYEEKERICGEGRKSYYKTDHDATAMCLKDDYYAGLGSSMHAAYQEQIAVSHGFVCAYHVSQDRTDMPTFTETMDFFRRNYHSYPRNVIADAGYGCEKTYAFCERNGIRAFIKYASWEGECTGRRPALFELNGDGTVTCLGGRTGRRHEPEFRHHKLAGSTFYRVDGCLSCPFRAYCKRQMSDKDEDFRIFEIRTEYQRQRQRARDLLLTPEGIEMRVNRSCQVEGAFGVIKADFGYTRSRRTSLAKVRNEFMMTVLGYDLRKYMRFKATGQGIGYWKAPPGLKPEKFRKPSAKRLAKRAAKISSRQPNEIAKSGYKY